MLKKRLYISVSVLLFFGFLDLSAGKLHELVQKSSYEETKQFLGGLSISQAEYLVNEEDKSGRTPLWYAIQRENKSHSGDLKNIKLLVKYGAKTKWKDSYPRFGRSYLHWSEDSCVFRYFLIEIEVEKRIPLSIQNNNEENPLEEAISLNQVAKIKQIFNILKEICVTKAKNGCRLSGMQLITRDLQSLFVK